jgi:hypothetical protein
MKFAILKPHSADCRNYWAGLECIGHKVELFQYDNVPYDRHHEIVGEVRSSKSDVVVFIGAHEASFGFPVLQTDNLKRIKDFVPLIHMCGDAGDDPWHEQLHKYDREDCFTYQVAIDGVVDCPIAFFKNGVVKLTPIDPRPFMDYRAWDERERFIGVTGGHGHNDRGVMMAHLIRRPDAYWMTAMDYGRMAHEMGDCKIIVNCPMTGSARHKHVKGRVLETAWSKACLFEQSNLHTKHWFKPWEDFIEFYDMDDLDRQLEWAKANDDEVQRIAANMRSHVALNHHPRIFWWDVLHRAGIKENVL